MTAEAALTTRLLGMGPGTTSGQGSSIVTVSTSPTSKMLLVDQSLREGNAAGEILFLPLYRRLYESSLKLYA